MSGSPAQKVTISYEVPEADASWEPASNLALRGIPKLWKVGVDPDVAVSP